MQLQRQDFSYPNIKVITLNLILYPKSSSLLTTEMTWAWHLG